MDIQAIARELQTVRDLLRFAVSRFNAAGLFYGHGTDNAWDEALMILLHTLHLPNDSGNEILDARLLEEERLTVLDLFSRRIEQRMPAAYLIRQAWFCGLTFYVDQRVLIPRSPVAELIETGFKPWYQGEYPDRILDLCTGSGCIGIACAYAFTDAEVVLSDIDEDALDVAQINIQRHQLQHRVSVRASDLLADVEGLFDIIVSNPPYVDAADFSAMPPEYQHEPPEALASGRDGLDHPLAILRQAADFLTEDGLLVLELGNSGQHLEQYYPGIDFNWVSFERGGHGVLVISRAELEYYADQLALAPDNSEWAEDF